MFYESMDEFIALMTDEELMDVMLDAFSDEMWEETWE